MRKKFLPVLIILCLALTCSAHAGLKDLNYQSSLPPIVVQGAMKSETDFLISSLEEPVEYKIGSWTYTAGKIDGYPVIISLTRMGVGNAAVATAFAIEAFNPVAVINQGTAGGHDPEIHRGDIVLAQRTYDIGAWVSEPRDKGKGVDFKDVKFNGSFYYDRNLSSGDIYLYSDKNLLKIIEGMNNHSFKGRIFKGTMASSNTWESRVDRILFFHEKLGSSAEDMESHSVADICEDYGVPFLGVRILSNSAVTQEAYNPATGLECQKFVLDFLHEYIKTLSK